MLASPAGSGQHGQMQLRDWPPRVARTAAQVASMFTWRLGLLSGLWPGCWGWCVCEHRGRP
eukprot:7241531-Alexandrium_andersonii.AAC.1